MRKEILQDNKIVLKKDREPKAYYQNEQEQKQRITT